MVARYKQALARGPVKCEYRYRACHGAFSCAIIFQSGESLDVSMRHASEQARNGWSVNVPEAPSRGRSVKTRAGPIGSPVRNVRDSAYARCRRGEGAIDASRQIHTQIQKLPSMVIDRLGFVDHPIAQSDHSALSALSGS